MSGGSEILDPISSTRPAATRRPADHAEAEHSGTDGETSGHEGGETGEGQQATHRKKLQRKFNGISAIRSEPNTSDSTPRRWQGGPHKCLTQSPLNGMSGSLIA